MQNPPLFPVELAINYAKYSEMVLFSQSIIHQRFGTLNTDYWINISSKTTLWFGMIQRNSNTSG